MGYSAVPVRAFAVRSFGRIFIIGLLSVLLALVADAVETLQLSSDIDKVALAPFLDFLIDESRELTISDVAGPKFCHQFQPAGPRTLSFGMIRSAVWLRFSLEELPRPPAPPLREWFLDIGWPFISHVDLYLPDLRRNAPPGDRDAWIVERAGQLAEYEPQEDPLRLLCVFRLPVDVQTPRTFFLRIESDAAIILPMTLYSQAVFGAKMNRRMLWYGLFYGIMLAIVVYSLLIYSSLKERLSLWLALSIVFVALYLATCDALTPVLLNLGIPGLLPRLRHFFLTGLMLTFGLFARAFLKGEEGPPPPDKPLLVFVGFAAFGMLMSPVAPMQFLMKYDAWVGFAAPLVFLPPAVFQWRKGFSPARFFLLGWVALAVLGSVDVLMIWGILPFTDWNLVTLQFGTALVALQFSHALGYRIRLLRNEREAALHASEERMRRFFERQLVGMAITAPDRKWLQTNDKLCEMLGYSREELLSIPWNQIVYLEDLPANLDQFNRLITGEIDGYSMESRFVRKDGEIVYTSMSIGCVRRLDGSLDYVLALLEDITERKRTEESLRESEETFRALAENSVDTVMRFDREYRHLYVNPIVERQTNIPPAAFIGKTHRELGFPEELCTLWENAVRQVFETRRPNRIEFQLPPGIWIDWLLVPEFDEAGEVRAVLASARDITEIKHAEEHRHNLEAQLAQAQKMESVGRLAGGVAHDFNNLLTVILGYAEIALADAKALSPMAQGQIQLIHKAGERARDLTRQLLAFGRKQTLQITDVDLNMVIVGFGKMLRRLIGEDIHVQNLLNPRISIVKADPAQIEQVFLNLALNARDAMPNGGRLTVETADVVLDEAYAAAHPDVAPGDYVMLAVSDTGCGMSLETQKKVFEPFFTTKDAGKGTGLGLATVYGIVKQHRGHISVYSELGHGTTFKVYLPRAVQEEQEGAAEAVFEALRGGSETVLLVEDDTAVRQLTCGILADLGYDVIEAESGRDAVRLAAERETIHLLLTDVIMPEMSGRQVFTEVAALHPNIKVLYMSGYTADVIAHHGVLDEGIHLLQKPFTQRSLAQKIRGVLDG